MTSSLGIRSLGADPSKLAARSLAPLFVAGFTVASSGLAASGEWPEWPQWRGPLATGVAPAGNPPASWSETNHVQWKFKIPGFGTSTPIVSGSQVFILTAVGTGSKAESPATTGPNATAVDPTAPPPSRGGGMTSEKPSESYQFLVVSVDRNTGRLRWQQVAREGVPHEGHHRDHGYASFSPITDGELLYAYFGSRGLHAYDLQGNRQWEVDLGEMRTRNGFGEGGSIALHADTLVVKWDHEGDDFIAAFDKRTGKERWRQPRKEISSWSTPLVVVHQNQPQVIASATDRVRAYDLVTGQPLWECAGMTQNVIPTPVAQDGIVYAISGFRGAALLAIRLGHTGNLTDSDAIAWRHAKNTPYVPSPLLYGHRLYFLSGNTGMLSSFDVRSGKPLIEAERVPGLSGVYASPVGAADRVYLVGRDGNTVVVRNADQLQVLATNTLEDKFDASAAVANNQLFLRGHTYLYCLAE